MPMPVSVLLLVISVAVVGLEKFAVVSTATFSASASASRVEDDGDDCCLGLWLLVGVFSGGGSGKEEMLEQFVPSLPSAVVPLPLPSLLSLWRRRLLHISSTVHSGCVGRKISTDKTHDARLF